MQSLQSSSITFMGLNRAQTQTGTPADIEAGCLQVSDEEVVALLPHAAFALAKRKLHLVQSG